MKRDAWMAGLLEGEGSFIVRLRAGHIPGVRVSCMMNDEDVIEKLWLTAGCGNVHYVRTRGMWSWECSRHTDVGPLLRRVLPYMGVRRSEQIQKCLDVWEVNDEARRAGLYRL